MRNDFAEMAVSPDKIRPSPAEITERGYFPDHRNYETQIQKMPGKCKKSPKKRTEKEGRSQRVLLSPQARPELQEGERRWR